MRSLRNLNNNGYYRLQKWAAIALARDLVPARGLDPWRRPKGSWALGTRMIRVEKMNAAFERVLETFQIENLKDLQREALEKLVSGLDVFVIQPTGSGKRESH